MMTRRELHQLLLKRVLPFDARKDTFVRYQVRFTQQQHWKWWLRDNRARDVETIYNRIQEPLMLAWLARDVGIQRTIVAKADRIAARRGPGATRCSMPSASCCRGAPSRCSSDASSPDPHLLPRSCRPRRRPARAAPPEPEPSPPDGMGHRHGGGVTTTGK